MYELYTTRQFERAYKSFIKLHPELKSAIREKLKQLLENPASPALRLHKLSGKLSNHHAVSITHSFRLIFMLEGSRIYLTNIGAHDDLYR